MNEAVSTALQQQHVLTKQVLDATTKAFSVPVATGLIRGMTSYSVGTEYNYTASVMASDSMLTVDYVFEAAAPKQVVPVNVRVQVDTLGQISVTPLEPGAAIMVAAMALVQCDAAASP